VTGLAVDLRQETVPATSVESRDHRRVALLALAGLLLLRFPLLTGVGVVLGRTPGWAFVPYLLGTYSLTAFLVWWERERLQQFFFDRAASRIFLCQVFCFPLGIGLFVRMRRAGARFPSTPPGLVGWLLAGAAVGTATSLSTFLLGIVPPATRGPQPAGVVWLLFMAAIQTTNAGVFEEPLFRGFLWGYLRLAGWRNLWILLLQAALFTGGHVYYLRGEALLPWLVRMMLPSLTIGIMLWVSRSLAVSMVTHGFTNAAGDILLHTRSGPEAVRLAAFVSAVLACAALAALAVRRLRKR
jgi:membrane protease YdiL (CAAX protease family)